jgi:uncharacterized protein YukE
MATILEEEANLPATLKAQDGGVAITESAFQEQLNQAMAQLQSEYQALQTQLNQISAQYPTPDCD